MAKSKKNLKKEKVTEDAVDVDLKIDNSTETKGEDEKAEGNDVSTKKSGKAVKKEEAPSKEDAKDDVDDSETQENGEVSTEKKPADKKRKTPKKAATTPAVEPARKSTRTPKPVAKENGDHESYEVEQVVGMRLKNGKKEFKIRWKGYKAGDDTWEPENNLSCQDLIKAYEDEHQDEESEDKKTPAKKAKIETAVSKSKRTKRK